MRAAKRSVRARKSSPHFTRLFSPLPARDPFRTFEPTQTPPQAPCNPLMEARMLASGRAVALARPGGGAPARAAAARPAVALPNPRAAAAPPTRAIAPPSTEYDESPVKMQIGDGVSIGEFSMAERGARGAGRGELVSREEGGPGARLTGLPVRSSAEPGGRRVAALAASCSPARPPVRNGPGWALVLAHRPSAGGRRGGAKARPFMGRRRRAVAQGVAFGAIGRRTAAPRPPAPPPTPPLVWGGLRATCGVARGRLARPGKGWGGRQAVSAVPRSGRGSATRPDLDPLSHPFFGCPARRRPPR